MNSAVRIILAAALSAAAFLPLYAEAPVDENALFSGDQPVVETKSYEKANVDEDQNLKKVAFSGSITSVYSYSATRGFLQGKGTDGNIFGPSIDGTGYLDVRLPENDKGFGAFNVVYDPVEKTTEYAMPELFVDFNIAKKIYFRTGKQVVQWGRCYLWNPTDLVNVEKKSFVDKIGPREGTYGIKAHLPFGTWMNMYGFVSTVGTNEAQDVAGTYKLEFLAGGTEMAFSVWAARGYNPVAGYDVSTRFLTLDIKGEASVSNGSNDDKVGVRNGVLTKYREDKVVVKACLDLGRSFDALDQSGKIQVNLEGFYNGSGYAENVLRDSSLYGFDAPLVMTVNGTKIPLSGGSKAAYMVGSGLYQPNYLSRYYAALFVTVNNFITSSMTLTANVIGNVSQKSGMTSVSLSYLTLQGFKAGATVNGYAGGKNTEYTFRNGGINGGDIRLTAGIVF
jgi:hypothetical protein